MKTKITVKTPKGNRYIQNGQVYKGYITTTFKKGVGKPYEVESHFDGIDDVWEEEKYHEYKTCHRCYWNSDVVLEDYKSQEEFKKDVNCTLSVTALDFIDMDKIIGTKFEKYLFKIGENKGGKFAELIDEEEEQRKELEEMDAKILRGQVPIRFTSGIFGFRASRIPTSLWGCVKHLSEYHKGDDDDYELAEDLCHFNPRKSEIKGWFFRKEAIDILFSRGVKVSVNNCCLDYDIDADRAISIARKRDEELNAALAEYNKEVDSVRNDYRRIISDAKLLTKEEVDSVASILRYKNSCYLENNLTWEEPKDGIILSRTLKVEGHNIYGGGSYLVKYGNNVYIVQNNGADGDDWSLNNMDTGGAGAIVSRIEYSKISKIFERVVCINSFINID